MELFGEHHTRAEFARARVSAHRREIKQAGPSAEALWDQLAALHACAFPFAPALLSSGSIATSKLESRNKSFLFKIFSAKIR